jgi:molybdenum cofactor synthesis domain-containing protein
LVEILEPTKLGQNIVKRASEMNSGETVFETGEVITQNMIATLASFGYENVKVSKRPRVAILATGSEIVDIGQEPGRDQIRNSNSWMLAEFAGNYADVAVLPIAKDDLEGLKETISEAAKSCDCLIISGGVSVGDYDFTKPALRELGAEIFFEKVALKPGKPTVFAKLNDTLIFGLPGNPVSVAVTFFVFVRTALLLMQGAKNPELKKGFAKLTHPIKATKERDAMLPVSLETNEKGELTVETLRFSGSSNFIAFSRANGLVFVPQDTCLAAGDVAKIFYL